MMPVIIRIAGTFIRMESRLSESSSLKIFNRKTSRGKDDWGKEGISPLPIFVHG
jgi:hypothetical protein